MLGTMDIQKNIKNSLVLNISMYSHLVCELFTCSYIFIFSKKYDIYFVFYLFCVMALKLIFNYECIWTYYDKKMIDPKYKLGDNPGYYPFRDLYGNNAIVNIVGLLILYSLGKIYLRNKNPNIKYLIIATLMMLFFIEAKIKKVI